MKSTIDIWKSYLKEKWKVYFAGLIAVIICNLMQVFISLNLGHIIDFFTKGEIPSFYGDVQGEEAFHLLFLSLVGASILLALGRAGWRLTFGRQTHFASGILRQSVWDHSRYFSFQDTQSEFTKGHIMNASNSDVNSARFLFGFTMIGAIDVFFLGIFTIISMSFIHLPMTLLAIACLLYLPFVIKRISDKEMKLYKKSQEILSTLNDLATQVVGSVRLQRLEQSGSFWTRKLVDSSEEFRKARLDAVERSLLYIPVFSLSTVLSYIVLFAYGIRLLFNNELTIGEFITMQGLIFLLQDPFEVMGWVISEWKKGMTSLDRLNKIFSNHKEEYLVSGNAGDKSVADYALEVKDLSFSYPDTDKEIISNFSFSLKNGGRLGITGSIGSGKSTLIEILSGLERDVRGSVLLGGKSYSDYSNDYIRGKIVYVHQKSFLFATSVRENICVDKKLTDDQVWSFLEQAGLKEDIQAFPEQLDTQLGEWGINLSGGQKQRLSLARGLARSPSLLLLDDCLSAVDTVTEDKILKSLNQNLKDTTIIWAAHRESTLKYCDEIIRMEINE